MGAAQIPGTAGHRWRLSATHAFGPRIGTGLDFRFLLFIKLLAILLLHARNFVVFTQAVRYANHVNFLINTPMIDEQPVTEEVVYKMLFRATTGGPGAQGDAAHVSAHPVGVWRALSRARHAGPRRGAEPARLRGVWLGGRHARVGRGARGRRGAGAGARLEAAAKHR